MSEGSLPPFKYLDPRRWRTYPARVREVAGRVISRFRLVLGRSGKPWNESGVSSESSGLSESEDNRFADSKGTTSPRDGGIKSDRDREPATRDEPGPSSAGISDADHARALTALREFLLENHTNVDRALRLRDRADRLEREDIPSDSAHNRASRAREEVVAGLAGLRRSLVEAGGDGAARALDLEVTRMSPKIDPDEIRR